MMAFDEAVKHFLLMGIAKLTMTFILARDAV